MQSLPLFRWMRVQNSHKAIQVSGPTSTQPLLVHATQSSSGIFMKSLSLLGFSRQRYRSAQLVQSNRSKGCN